MRNSATDNPRFLSILIGDWLNSWKNRKGQAQKSYSEALPLNINDKGQYIFATHCAACHTIGHGDKIGPDLMGVSNVRERAWLTRFILRPDQMIKNGDPIALDLFRKYKEVNMPNLRLADEDIKALVDYLEAQSAEDKTLPKAAAEKPDDFVVARPRN
jgi:protein SCO1